MKADNVIALAVRHRYIQLHHVDNDANVPLGDLLSHRSRSREEKEAKGKVAI